MPDQVTQTNPPGWLIDAFDAILHDEQPPRAECLHAATWWAENISPDDTIVESLAETAANQALSTSAIKTISQAIIEEFPSMFHTHVEPPAKCQRYVLKDVLTGLSADAVWDGSLHAVNDRLRVDMTVQTARTELKIATELHEVWNDVDDEYTRTYAAYHAETPIPDYIPDGFDELEPVEEFKVDGLADFVHFILSPRLDEADDMYLTLATATTADGIDIYRQEELLEYEIFSDLG